MKVLFLVKERRLLAAQHGVTEASEDILGHLGHGDRGELGPVGMRRLPAVQMGGESVVELQHKFFPDEMNRVQVSSNKNLINNLLF